MTEYLKVTNRGTVEREFWELVGATNKDKEDKSLIGFKGSGAKFATIAALRLGIGITITSWDKFGPYTLRYFTQTTPLGFSQIMMNYNNGESVKPTSFTTNSLQDWDRPIGDDQIRSFKLLREILANAYDEDKDFGIKRAERVELSEKGYTNVYLEWRPEYEEVLARPERYFKFLSKIKPLWTMDAGRLSVSFYPRSDNEHIRVFIQGLLVHCQKGIAAFDYSLDDKNLLSEERILKDFNSMLEQIVYAFLEVDDLQCVKTLLQFLLIPESFEVRAITDSGKNDIWIVDFNNPATQEQQEVWRRAWEERFGSRTIVGAPLEDGGRTLRHLGYTIIDPKCWNIEKFLNGRKIPNAHQVYNSLSEKQVVPWKEINLSEQKIFLEALRIFKETYPDNVHLPKIIFFRQEKRTFDGEAIEGNIWVNVAVLREGIKETIGVLVHEYRHVATKCRDYDRDFTRAADDIIVRLLLQANESKKSFQ